MVYVTTTDPNHVVKYLFCKNIKIEFHSKYDLIFSNVPRTKGIIIVLSTI